MKRRKYPQIFLEEQVSLFDYAEISQLWIRKAEINLV